MKNIHFVINKENREFELWVDGKCITDCFSLSDDSTELMEQLVEFAHVPCYIQLDAQEIVNTVNKINLTR